MKITKNKLSEFLKYYHFLGIILIKYILSNINLDGKDYIYFANNEENVFIYSLR